MYAMSAGGTQSGKTARVTRGRTARDRRPSVAPSSDREPMATRSARRSRAASPMASSVTAVPSTQLRRRASGPRTGSPGRPRSTGSRACTVITAIRPSSGASAPSNPTAAKRRTVLSGNGSPQPGCRRQARAASSKTTPTSQDGSGGRGNGRTVRSMVCPLSSGDRSRGSAPGVDGRQAFSGRRRGLSGRVRTNRAAPVSRTP